MDNLKFGEKDWKFGWKRLEILKKKEIWGRFKLEKIINLEKCGNLEKFGNFGKN